MMQSAPISRAAATVLSRCCATSVSTVGTPVMSMIAIVESVSTMRSSRLSMTTWVRALSSVPISGTATTPSHSFTTGVESSMSSSCWRADDLLAAADERLGRDEPEPVEQLAGGPQRGAELVRAPVERPLHAASKNGCLSERTNVAVSVGVNPWSARDRESSLSTPRTSAHAGALMSAVASSAATAAANAVEEALALDPQLVRAEQIRAHVR